MISLFDTDATLILIEERSLIDLVYIFIVYTYIICLFLLHCILMYVFL